MKNSDKIGVLLGLENDVVCREGLDEFFEVTRKPTEYRYDRESGLIYCEKEIEKSDWTYIAKAEVGNIFKIGHTSNLKQRADILRTQKPYSYLNLRMIAYHCRNCEKIALIFSSKGRKLPRPFEKMEEIRLLSDDDLNYLVESFGFKPADPDNLPVDVRRFERMYYDPDNGNHIKTEYFIEESL